MAYLINSKANTTFKSGSGNEETIDVLIFEKALHDVHNVVDKITKDIPVDIFSILGMRNLSAFIGELFAKSLAKESKNRFIKNPHQDGYPDLLLMDKSGIKLYEEIRARGGLRDKSPFSPFPNGGIEIKATCGSVPTPTQCAKLGIEKPDMGETRIAVMRGYDWKAHHRETNNLVGILWDFLDGVPHIVAVFFGNTLTENDWGKIVQPKEGGGRTTSVSIMPRSGVNKMYQNWIAVKEDRRYVKFINEYNSGNLIKLQT
jgi:hypothetical protein